MVRNYVRYSPVARGKFQLLRRTLSWLYADLGGGLSMKIEDPGDYAERCLFLYGFLEGVEAGLILSLIQPGMTVYDVGANLGVYSLHFSRAVGPGGRVVAFEPTPRLIERMQRQFAALGVSNVAVAPVALSDRGGPARLFLGEGSERNSLVVESGEGMAVETVKLDDYLASGAAAAPDFVKIDVEGSEERVLRGGEGLFASPAAPPVMIEFNPEALVAGGSSDAALQHLLESYGYQCFLLHSHKDGEYYNVLAVKTSHPERFPALAGLRLKPLALPVR